MKIPCKTFHEGVKCVKRREWGEGEFKWLQLTTQDKELSATFLYVWLIVLRSSLSLTMDSWFMNDAWITRQGNVDKL